MSEKLPDLVEELRSRHPDVWQHYQALDAALADAGPLDARTRRLVKLALALGSRNEGSVRSHVRRAVRDGLSREELLHVALLGVTTLGWSRAMTGRAWIQAVLNGPAGKPAPRE